MLLEGRRQSDAELLPADDERIRHTINVLDLSGSNITDMRLYESMLWETSPLGVRLLARHFARLRKSAAELGFTVPPDLEERFTKNWSSKQTARVKLVLSKNGSIEISSMPHTTPPLQKFRLLLSRVPIDSASPLIRHKTSDRSLYQAPLALLKGSADDVVLFNERGQVTEGTSVNLAVQLVMGGPWLTPALECGLVPGVMREEMLSKGELQEAIITVDQFRSAVAIKVLNVVRGSMSAVLVASP